MRSLTWYDITCSLFQTVNFFTFYSWWCRKERVVKSCLVLNGSFACIWVCVTCTRSKHLWCKFEPLCPLVIPPLCKVWIFGPMGWFQRRAFTRSLMESSFERKRNIRHLWKCRCVWQDKTELQLHSYLHCRAECYVHSGRHNYCNSMQFGCSHIGDGTEAITAGGLLTSQSFLSLSLSVICIVSASPRSCHLTSRKGNGNPQIPV